MATQYEVRSDGLYVPRNTPERIVFPWVDFDLPLTPAYWQSGRAVNPPVAQPRITRMGEYDKLLRNDFSPVGISGRDQRVMLNMMSFAENKFLNIIMARPPIYEGAPDDFDVEYMNNQVEMCLTDYFRYGTCVFWVPDDQSMPRRLHPRNWFPSTNGQSVRLVEAVLDESGQTKASGYRVNVHRYSIEEPAILEFTGATDINLGELSAVTPLRVEEIPVYPVQRPPRNNVWGQSIIDQVATKNAEVVRRFSKLSYNIDESGVPVFVTSAGTKTGQSALRDAIQQNQWEEQQYNQSRQTDLAQQRVNGHVHLDGYETAAFLSPDAGQGEFAAMVIEMLLKEGYSELDLPESLRGITPGGFPSGEAFKQAHFSNYVMDDRTQAAFVASLSKALTTAGYNIQVRFVNPYDSYANNVPRPDLEGYELATGMFAQGGNADIPEGEE